MQQLHLVGFTADLEGLIFSAKKGARSGAYVIAMDDSLLTALEEARKMVSAAAVDEEGRSGKAKQLPALGRTGRTSALSVREVQSRLRSGSSLAEIAEAAGVDEGWVARFAAPVVAEQAAVVNRTLPLVFETARKGPSAMPLGEAVRWNLSDRGIVIDDSSFDVQWSAFQVTPRQWAVRFTYQSRGRAQVAEWEVDLDEGQLVARNRLASDLAFVEAGARRRRPADADVAAPTPRRASAGKRSTASRAVPTPATKKTATRKAATRKAATKKGPAMKAAGGKATKAAASKARATKAPAAKKAAPRPRTASTTKKAVEKPSPPAAPEPPRLRPGNQGVTRAQAAAPPAPSSRSIGNPGRPRPSATPYRPTVPAPAARPTPARRPPPSDEVDDVSEPATDGANPAAPPRPRAPIVIAPSSAQPRRAQAVPVVTPQRNTVPAVPVPARPAPEPSAPAGGSSGNVRRLPSPSAAAVAHREQAQPSHPDADADGRPSILVIDAEQAGRRRPSR